VKLYNKPVWFHIYTVYVFYQL